MNAPQKPLTEFPRQMLGLIRCSRDGSELTIAGTAETGNLGIIHCVLRCASCRQEYSIRDGIARLLATDLSTEDQHEMQLRDAEYEQNTSAGYKWGSRLGDRIEVAPHLAALGDLEGKTVLELGCGDGRFTIPMARLGADVVGLDFSLSGLYRLSAYLRDGVAPSTYGIRPRRRLGEIVGHIALVQADASQFFAAPKGFDRALSATPLDSRDQRMKMYHSIAEALKDDGRFIGGVEHDDLTRRLLGEPLARRYTEGGIFIEHFAAETMRSEAAPYFRRISIRPIRPRIPFLKAIPLGLAVGLAKTVARIPGLKQLGEILLMRAEDPTRPPSESPRAGNRTLKTAFAWYWRLRFGKPASAARNGSGSSESGA
jgi:SAM-dependent methyltransferase